MREYCFVAGVHFYWKPTDEHGDGYWLGEYQGHKIFVRQWYDKSHWEAETGRTHLGKRPEIRVTTKTRKESVARLLAALTTPTTQGGKPEEANDGH